jgi:hypothetical protein
LLAVVKSLAHRVTLHHRVDREVLADIAQRLDKRQLTEPVEVVVKQRRRRTRKVEQPLEDESLPLYVVLNGVAGQKLPLSRLARRIANEPGAAAHHHHRLMTGSLPVHQQLDRDEVANRQRVSGRVEADIGSADTAREVGAQGFLVAGLVQEAAAR